MPQPVVEVEEELKELPESEKFINVEVTDVLNAAEFYVHIVGNTGRPRHLASLSLSLFFSLSLFISLSLLSFSLSLSLVLSWFPQIWWQLTCSVLPASSAIQFVQESMKKFGEAVASESVPSSKTLNFAPEKGALVAGVYSASLYECFFFLVLCVSVLMPTDDLDGLFFLLAWSVT